VSAVADDGVIPFPLGDDEDALVAARLRALYDAFPAASDAQVAACRDAVRSQALDAAGGESRWLGRYRWWWGGAAAAALLAVVVMRPVKLDDASRRAVDSAAASALVPSGSTRVVDGGQAMEFELRLPADTRRVALVGDFNGWDSDSTLMVRREGNGTWSAKIPLTPGVHNYAFVVDGQRWMVDPLAPQVPDAGFGPANAVVVVGSR
jgi:hypothetical protein